jgi:phosphonate transport system substrate-binding protein
MSPGADSFYQALAHYLSRHSEVSVVFYHEGEWQERQHLLDTGQVESAFICGLPYTIRVDGAAEPPLALLAAPVMAGSRYAGRPVYYSDVVVRRDTPYCTFADLRGASWACNEPGSFSGHLITCYELARRGEGSRYFGSIVYSGSHLRSLAMVLAGEVAATAIDSTVLELACRQQPHLAGQLRVVEVFGPAPIPPAVISTRVAPGLRSQLGEKLQQMHQNEDGAAVLAAAGVARFTAVADADYDPIRQIAHLATTVTLEQ